MLRVFFVISVLAITAAPFTVHAAVLINEVAWMGSHESAADEWIELHNTGAEAVDLTGWTLTDGDSLTIDLEGAIADGAYAVLERTDDDSAPGEAFLLYTGALTNGGATLRLMRADGELEDQVAGGTDWRTIGGDNETKMTAQLSDSGWITASATPGRENAAAAGIPSNEDQTEEEESGEADELDESDTEGGADAHTEESDGASGGHGPNERISLTPPDTELVLAVEENINTYVARSVAFRADASGIGAALIDSLAYTWNFGDGSVSKKRAPTHAYAFPGTYVVVVEASYARHTARARIEVNVLPITASLARTDGGDIMIHNDVSYEADLSGMVLSNGTKTFRFPEHTILPARGTITLPSSRTDLQDVRTISLINTNGEQVAQLPTPERSARLQQHTRTSAAFNGGGRDTHTSVRAHTSPKTERVIAGDPARATTVSTAFEGASTNTVPAAAAAAAGTADQPLSGRLSLLALLGVIGVGILALYSIRLPS